MTSRKNILAGLLVAIGLSAITPVHATLDMQAIAGAALLTSLFLLFRKKADPDFAEHAYARLANAKNPLYKAWHAYNDFIVGQLEKDPFLTVTDKKNIKLSSSKEADAFGVLGIICTEVEPFLDAKKNLYFLAALYTFITAKPFTLPALRTVVIPEANDEAE